MTPLSNLYDASELRLYLRALPIIDSGLKYAHSISALLVSLLHEVLLSPITPAKFMGVPLDENMQLLLVSLIFFPSNVSNSKSNSTLLNSISLFILSKS